MTPAWEEQYPVTPANNNKPCKMAVSCEHLVKGDVDRLIVTQNFPKTIKMLTLSKCPQNFRFLRSHQAILLKSRKLSFLTLI